MSSNFQNYFGFVTEEIFELGPTIKFLCFDTCHTLTPEPTLIDLSPNKLHLNPPESIRYLVLKMPSEMMFWFCSGQILLALAYDKNLNSLAQLFKKLDTMFVLIYTMLL